MRSVVFCPTQSASSRSTHCVAYMVAGSGASTLIRSST
jgi:hypothetical protein